MWLVAAALALREAADVRELIRGTEGEEAATEMGWIRGFDAGGPTRVPSFRRGGEYGPSRRRFKRSGADSWHWRGTRALNGPKSGGPARYSGDQRSRKPAPTR